MGKFRSECVSSTLMCCKGNVRTTVSKVKQHSNQTGIVDLATSRRTIKILAQGSLICGRSNYSSIFGIQPKGIDDTFSQTNLSESDCVTIPFNIHAEITLCHSFHVQSDIFYLHLSNKVVNVFLMMPINEDIINVNDNNDDRTEKKTWVKSGWSEG
jgi:hypothetical protein